MVDTNVIISYILIVILICFSALFSGLTLGLLGLDKIGLKIVMSGDDPKLAASAAKIAPLRENGNLLLCTLLLGNVAVNAYLSILMAEITSGILGFLISTVMIVIFGEIIPQASCSRYALQIGSVAVPLVRILIVLMYPFTKPLSLLLDWILGDELGTIHSRTELTELLKIHVQHGAMDIEAGQTATGAITYQEKLVKEAMTPYDQAYILSASDLLNFKKITEIFRSGFSRIPVFEKDKHDIIGVILVKDLIFVDPDDCTPVRNFIQIFGRSFHLIWPDDKLGDVLKMFKKGKSHMAIVRDVNNEGEGDPFYEVKGLLTIEDILEEILGDEIMDETDVMAAAEQLPDDNTATATADGRGAGTDGQGQDGDLSSPGLSGASPGDKFDYSKLRLLDSGKLEYDQLTRTEALAIGAYFQRNIKPFLATAAGYPLVIPDNILDCLLFGCPIIDQVRMGDPDNLLHPHPSDVLFRNGVEADYLIMVLTGKVVVSVGRDHYRSEAGPWSVLGADALLQGEAEVPAPLLLPPSAPTSPEARGGANRGPKGSAGGSAGVSASVPYIPDFTAFIGSDSLRYIKLSKQHYKIALQGVAVWRTANKLKGVVFSSQQPNKSPFKTQASTVNSPPPGGKIDNAAASNDVVKAYTSKRAISVGRKLGDAMSSPTTPSAETSETGEAGTVSDHLEGKEADDAHAGKDRA